MAESPLPRSRRRIAAENADEVSAWIEERVDELTRAGMSRSDARRAALQEFGNLGAALDYAGREDAVADRRIRISLWAEEAASDIRIASRTLIRTPAVTAVVLLTFALGIGAATAIYSVMHALLLRPLPYADEATLVYIPALDGGALRPGLGGGRHSAGALVAFRTHSTSFAGIAGATTGNYILSGSGDPEQISGSSLTPNAFDVLGASASLGRAFTASEDQARVVVLLDGLWRRRFGADSAIIGKSIVLSGESHEVIGVMPRGFRVPTYEQAEMLLPQSLTRILSNPGNAEVRFLRLFGRMKPGVAAEIVNADVARVLRGVREQFPRSYADVTARAEPVRTAVSGDARPRVLMLMGAALFVLLIACANVAGLLLSRALARRKELAVRTALGAGRGRLIRQFLGESIVLAVAGGAIGLAIAQLGVMLLRRGAGPALPLGTEFSLEPGVVLPALGAAVVAAVGASLLPAISATGGTVGGFQLDTSRQSPSRARRRQQLALVTAQLGVSVVLLIGAGLFARSYDRLSVIDLGYQTESAITFRIQYTRPHSAGEQDAFWSALYAGLRAIPGVTEVGGGNLPLSGNATISRIEAERAVNDMQRVDARYTPASDGYFAALGIPVLQGRPFGRLDVDGGTPVAIVSVSLARQLWGDGAAIGRRVRTGPLAPWLSVVGVAGDVRVGASDVVQPSLYTSQRQDHWPGGGTVIVRATGNPSTVMASARQVVRRVDASLPVIGIRTLDDFRSDTPAVAERRLQTELMAVFAALALVVSSIGIFGAAAYAVEARRHEFGIRVALGARRGSILWLGLRDGLIAAGVATAIGVPLAIMLASRAKDQLYSTSAFEPVVVGTALLVTMAVALLATLAPARRAAAADPVRALSSQ